MALGLEYCVAKAAELGGDCNDVHVLGQSAGAQLCVQALLRRDRLVLRSVHTGHGTD